MIFLSFAGENAELARALGLRMRAAGAEVWCSVFKDDLDDGHPWPDQIYAALKRCSVFVLLVTEAPIDGMTKEESDYARNRYNKLKRPRVVSVRLSEDIELPERYESLQAVVLPPDWQSDSSDFVARKLRRWDELAAPDPAPVALSSPPQTPASPPKVAAISAPPAQQISTASPRPLQAPTPLRPARRLRVWAALAIAVAALAWIGRGWLNPPAHGAPEHSTPEGQPVDRGENDRASGAQRPPTPASHVLDMVRIPAGKFLLGSAASTFDDERPQHEVTLAAFELAKTEVTRGQWREVMRIDPPEAGWSSDRSDDLLPATKVTWDEAREFCDELSKPEGLDAATRYRLPNEAEWEYACRAGTTTEYWSGNEDKDLDRVGWYAGNSKNRLQAVGQKPANSWGLFDMHGNVLEWCEDTWHDSYGGAPSDGSAWVDKASPLRVIRGGSFVNTAERARSARRGTIHPSLRWPGLGFRPARSVTAD